jgi:NAD(P)-dependent dehydrogenase (short-subunit alcohol dehydrogenase family)
MGLDGSRVLVAGAGGLGSACVAGFVRAGATVAVADADQSRLKQVVDGAAEDGQSVVAICADLTDSGRCREAVTEAADTLGGLDVLVHAVGINNRQPLLDFSDDEWDLILKVNLSSAYWLGQAAGRLMCAQRSGRMVFISSVSGLLAHKDHGPYAASKGGMNQLIRVMAAEWAQSGVRVNAVAPGYVETALTERHLSRAGVRDALEALVPAGRLGTAQDVVGPTLFLASPLSSFVTGHVLYVDGGRTLV